MALLLKSSLYKSCLPQDLLKKIHHRPLKIIPSPKYKIHTLIIITPRPLVHEQEAI